MVVAYSVILTSREPACNPDCVFFADMQGVKHYAALLRAGVRVSLDGQRVYAPPGVIDADGFADLTTNARKPP